MYDNPFDNLNLLKVLTKFYMADIPKIGLTIVKLDFTDMVITPIYPIQDITPFLSAKSKLLNNRFIYRYKQTNFLWFSLLKDAIVNFCPPKVMINLADLPNYEYLGIDFSLEIVILIAFKNFVGNSYAFGFYLRFPPFCNHLARALGDVLFWLYMHKFFLNRMFEIQYLYDFQLSHFPVTTIKFSHKKNIPQN